MEKDAAPKLFMLGFMDGIKINLPIKWILLHAVVREAVAACVFWAGVAFLAAMTLAEVVKARFPTASEGTLRVIFMYAGSMTVQNICASKYKTIASVLQRKTQHSPTSLLIL